jgi:hypothetical protein
VNEVAQKILELVRRRGAQKSVCPSEVARALDEKGWRSLMKDVRREAAELARKGRIEVLQKGEVVDIASARGAIRLRLKKKHSPDVDYRKHPERYVVGRGEEGVLTVQPYKSELLPLWRFKTLEMAKTSAKAIEAKFEEYRAAGDAVGMDMARKYLMMGVTRSKRYDKTEQAEVFARALRRVTKHIRDSPSGTSRRRARR